MELLILGMITFAMHYYIEQASHTSNYIDNLLYWSNRHECHTKVAFSATIQIDCGTFSFLPLLLAPKWNSCTTDAWRVSRCKPIYFYIKLTVYWLGGGWVCDTTHGKAYLLPWELIDHVFDRIRILICFNHSSRAAYSMIISSMEHIRLKWHNFL